MQKTAPYTILAVNDIPDQLQILAMHLRVAGYNVLEAANPKAAIRLATDQRPDLIISDLSVPQIDGLDLHRSVRSTRELADTPILVISALHLPPDSPKQNASSTTRDDFIEAPYEPLELVAKIARLIERKRTEDELRHSQNRYIDLFDNANDVIYTHDLDGHYTSLNKQGERITGYSSEEASKLDFNTLASPEDVALAKEMLRRKLEGQETSTVYQVEIRAKDGKTIPFEVNTQLIYQDGVPVGVQGIARDITERKQAEESLRKISEELLEAERRAINDYKLLVERIAHLAQTLASARDLNLIFEALLEFTTISLPCDALGIALYNHEQVESTPHFFWIEEHKVDTTNLEPISVTTDSDLRRAIVSGQTIISTAPDVESPLPTIFSFRDTDFKPASTMTVPMTIMGRTIGTVEIQSTVPNAYQPEHATPLEMAANLAANTIENVRLLQREREIEQQLQQSQKMEALGHLAGGVAHDFNNIVTAIYGFCDMLLRGLEKGNPLRVDVENIRHAAKRAELLTRELLAFSRKEVLQPVNLSLNSVVTDMELLLTKLIGEDITMIHDLAPNLPQIRADKGQLGRIIMNLAVNARDAMPNGGRITIQTSLVHPETKRSHAVNHTSAQPQIQLLISDTGVGMSPEVQAQIFEPFFTTKEPGKGTGLGLATVYGSVKQSGGSIWFDSKEGEGTTFKINFPVAQDHIDIAPEPILTDQAISNNGHKNLLIVEDDPNVRSVLRDALEGAGFHVLDAPDGREAWKVFQENQDTVDLVITDVLMPQMNGKQLATLINETRPDIPIIYTSGHPEDVITNRGVLHQGVNFVPKPFQGNDVVEKVRQVLTSQTPVDQAR